MLKRLVGLAGLAVIIAGCSAVENPEPPPASGPATFAMSLVVPKDVSPSGLLARAALAGPATCPDLVVTVAGENKNLTMNERKPGDTTKGHFDSLISCNRAIPADATSASVNDQSIPASMPKDINSIAAMGDTGCRVGSNGSQNCNSPSGWPLNRNAEQIVNADPDLLILTGDYYYRLAACPKGDEDKCGGSPPPPGDVDGAFLDSAAGWEDDFFEPLKPTFSKMPLIVLRGNHETCAEAGNGYMLYLDTQPGSAASCAPQPDSNGKLVAPRILEPARSLELPLTGDKKLRLAAVDTSNSIDVAVTPWWKRLAKQFEIAQTFAKGADDAILLSHRPILGLMSKSVPKSDAPNWTPWLSLDATAGSRGKLDPYSLVLSSHEHLLQMVQVPTAPPQFITGGGGTTLDPPKGYIKPKYGALAKADGQRWVKELKPYPKLQDRWQKVTWGHGILSPTDDGWQMEYRSPEGDTIQTCQVTTSGGSPTATC
jgi:hypothetical protein